MSCLPLAVRVSGKCSSISSTVLEDGKEDGALNGFGVSCLPKSVMAVENYFAVGIWLLE